MLLSKTIKRLARITKLLIPTLRKSAAIVKTQYL